MKAAIAILLAATMSAAVADDRESGFLAANTPVCKSLSDLREIWGLLQQGRFPAALEMINSRECFLGKGHHLYLANERMTDAARVVVIADDSDSGGEHRIYADYYTLIGGMRCLMNCPDGARGYHN